MLSSPKIVIALEADVLQLERLSARTGADIMRRGRENVSWIVALKCVPEWLIYHLDQFVIYLILIGKGCKSFHPAIWFSVREQCHPC
jgi:hypothetical protein